MGHDILIHIAEETSLFCIFVSSFMRRRENVPSTLQEYGNENGLTGMIWPRCTCSPCELLEVTVHLDVTNIHKQVTQLLELQEITSHESWLMTHNCNNTWTHHEATSVDVPVPPKAIEETKWLATCLPGLLYHAGWNCHGGADCIHCFSGVPCVYNGEKHWFGESWCKLSLKPIKRQNIRTKWFSNSGIGCGFQATPENVQVSLSRLTLKVAMHEATRIDYKPPLITGWWF